MSALYSPAVPTPDVVHRLTPQGIYDAVIGIRSAEARRRILADDVAVHHLDRRLRGGQIIRTRGTVNGRHGWLSCIVRLVDDSTVAMAVEVDWDADRPVRSAVIL